MLVFVEVLMTTMLSLASRGVCASVLVVLLVVVARASATSYPSDNMPRQRFMAGPWKQAHATFYEGGSGSFGGACGYTDVEKEGYGTQTTALSDVLFKDGQGCGACFEIKCAKGTELCKLGQPSLTVTGTNRCPPDNSGGWCNPPKEHFDIAKPGFAQLAEYKAGVIPVEYRRVPCKREGGMRFTITGHKHYNEVLVSNVGGAGDLISVDVRGNDKLKWTPLTRKWGQKWTTGAMLVGETLTFRIRTSDGRTTISRDIAPANWQFGQTFLGKNL